MNAKDALAVIKDVEKTGDKGMKEDDRRGWKRSAQIIKLEIGVNKKMKKLLEQ